MKYFLIYCQYDYYCQGWDETWGYFLVKARSFQEACQKLAERAQTHKFDFSNPREFKNHTIE